MSGPPPVWHGWGEEAFRRARDGDRCLILFLTAPWDAWGRRMEREGWSDPEVARLLEAYVPVKVDADLHPDVNDRYNPGPLPATAFCDPEGTLLYATGLLEGRDLRVMLAQFDASFRGNRERLAEAVRERDRKVDQILRGRHSGPAVPARLLVERTRSALLADVDPIHGGFGRGPKRAMAESLRCLLSLHAARPDPETAKALTRTLEAMGRGLYDVAEGGFFHGTAEEHWGRPDTAKLADENARLLEVILDAGLALGQERFLELGRHLAEWMRHALVDPATGRFLSSRPADDEYYLLPVPERTRRGPPEADATSYTDRGSRVASAFWRAEDVLGDASFGAAAKDGLMRILTENRDPEVGISHCPGGPHGLLRDRLALGGALLEGHGRTGDPRFLAEAERIGAALVPEFWSGEERGLLDRKAGVEEWGELRRKRSDPGETGEGILYLLRLAAQSGEESYRTQAERMMEGLPDYSPDWGHLTAPLALAADFLERGPAFVPRDDRRAYHPRRVLRGDRA